VLVHSSPPLTLTPGKHTIRACVSNTRAIEIYADGVKVSATITSQQTGLVIPALPWATPDLQGGTVTVGSDGSTPFHGYLSKALVCAYTTNAANCQ
jgi:hypothetical protein